jgi:hypothetical protein
VTGKVFTFGTLGVGVEAVVRSVAAEPPVFAARAAEALIPITAALHSNAPTVRTCRKSKPLSSACGVS